MRASESEFGAFRQMFTLSRQVERIEIGPAAVLAVWLRFARTGSMFTLPDYQK